MAQVVVLGAGIAGHTAALYLSKFLKKKDGHSVVVVSPRPTYNWIPSNIWVGTGKMDRKQVIYELEPIYRRVGVDFRLLKNLSSSIGEKRCVLSYSATHSPFRLKT